MIQSDTIRLIFMGTSEFAIPVLNALQAVGYNIPMVISQPDRPRGRRQTLSPTPVKMIAEKLGLSVYQPESIRLPEAIDTIKSIAPDLIITASYGQILRQLLLSIPRFGTLNVHASLLPELRGASPIQSAIIEGKSTTGCTIMLTERGVDSGPILSQKSIEILETDTAGTMLPKLAQLGADLLIKTIPPYIEGCIEPLVQDHARATYARQLSSHDGWIDWNRTAIAISQQVRGMNPCPGCYTSCGEQRLKIHFALPYPEGDTSNPPGTIVGCVNGKGCLIQTGEGILLCEDLQPACRKRMRGDSLLQGRFADSGDILGIHQLIGDSQCQE
ncbi:methionyl-tRNA formyltransferase [bacterium]|nr:methionyl-tRNA formyltransferase [candidate division CSSED10-310 bacterium]